MNFDDPRSEDDYDLAEFQSASHPHSEAPVSTAAPSQEVRFAVFLRSNAFKKFHPDFWPTLAVFSLILCSICPILWRNQFAVRSQQPSPNVHDSLARGDPPQRWYSALHDLAVCSRYMAERFWIPATERDGIPYDVVENTVNMLMRWRDDHLATVGAMNDLQSHTDYVAAVGACKWIFFLHCSSDVLIVNGLGASDCSYNVLWVILSQAMEDFGIKEVNEIMRDPSASARVLPNGDGTGALSSTTPVGLPPHLSPMVQLERAVANEALKSATRIAGLVRLVTVLLTLTADVMRFNDEGRGTGIEWIHAARSECHTLAHLFCGAATCQTGATRSIQLHRWIESEWVCL